jgi:hypothetical protein
MKVLIGVTGNDWSNNGLRRRAQGTRKLIAQSKNRARDRGAKKFKARRRSKLIAQGDQISLGKWKDV